MTSPRLPLFATCLSTAIAYGQAATDRAGVGIAIDLRQGTAVIAGVKEGGPAAQAGIVAGDVLLAVEAMNVRGMEFAQIAALVSGPADTFVNLTVGSAGGQPRVVRVQRRANIAVRPPQPDGGGAVPKPGGANPFDMGATPVTGGVQKFVPLSVRDPAANDVVAFTILVPDGWTSTGSVEWMYTLARLVNLHYAVSDPKTGASVRGLPANEFAFNPRPVMPMQPGSNYMGRLWVPPPRDPAELVQTVWANELPHLRGLQPIAREAYPKASQIALDGLKELQGEKAAQSVRLRYRFDERGRSWEEDVYLTVARWELPGLGNVNWNVDNAQVFRAPAGQLDAMPELRAVGNSLQTTTQWIGCVRVVQELFAKGLQQQLTSAAEMGAKLREYQDYSRKLAEDAQKERSASADRISAAVAEVVGGGSARFKGKGGAPDFHAPSYAKEAYTNAKGEVAIDDGSGTFDPKANGGGWEKMEKDVPKKPE